MTIKLVLGTIFILGIGLVGIFLFFEYTAYCWRGQYKEKTLNGFLKFFKGKLSSKNYETSKYNIINFKKVKKNK